MQSVEQASQAVISGANPYHTFLELCPQSELPSEFKTHVRHTDYSCGAMKINCAVDSLPNFLCCPNSPDGKPGMQHRGTIHFETSMQELDGAYRQASVGIPAKRPIVEMTIPSALDDTLAPEGKHVVQFFIQYAPYDLAPGVGSWADEAFKNAFADRCFAIVDECVMRIPPRPPSPHTHTHRRRHLKLFVCLAATTAGGLP